MPSESSFLFSWLGRGNRGPKTYTGNSVSRSSGVSGKTDHYFGGVRKPDGFNHGHRTTYSVNGRTLTTYYRANGDYGSSFRLGRVLGIDNLSRPLRSQAERIESLSKSTTSHLREIQREGARAAKIMSPAVAKQFGTWRAAAATAEGLAKKAAYANEGALKMAARATEAATQAALAQAEANAKLAAAAAEQASRAAAKSTEEAARLAVRTTEGLTKAAAKATEASIRAAAAATEATAKAAAAVTEAGIRATAYAAAAAASAVGGALGG
jgi:hypothetical protein